MIILKLILSLVLPLVLGYSVIQVIFQEKQPPFFFRLAISYGLGMGLLPQWMFVLGVLGTSYSLPIIGLPAFFAAILLFLYSWRKKKGHSVTYDLEIKDNKLGLVYYPLAVYVCFNIIYVFWSALNIPFYEWDVIATSAFKAKILFFERTLRFLKNFPHYSYPLHIPLLELWVALNLGFWHDQFIKIIFPFFYLSFLSVQYYFLRRFTNRRYAIFGLTLLVSSNFFTFHATTAYRDFPLLYYNCSTIIFLILWNAERKNSWLFLAALFSGFTSFVKSEGTIYFFVHSIIFLSLLYFNNIFFVKEKAKSAVKFFGASLPICLFYHIYKYLAIGYRDGNDFNINHLVFDFSAKNLLHAPVILTRIVADLFLFGNWNIIWFLLFASLLNFRKEDFTVEVKVIGISLIIFFSILLLGFSFTKFYKSVVDTHDPLSRSILHFFPLATLLIVLIMNQYKKTVKNKR